MTSWMMSPDDINMSSSAHGGETDTQVARVGAVMSYDHHILKPSRSMDDKAVLAAHVTKIQAGS